jgi:hypothetical protein
MINDQFAKDKPITDHLNKHGEYTNEKGPYRIRPLIFTQNVFSQSLFNAGQSFGRLLLALDIALAKDGNPMRLR